MQASRSRPAPRGPRTADYEIQSAPMTTRAVEQPRESSLREWGNLIVLSLALSIIIIDSTLLNVSLSTLVRDLHTTLQSLQSFISSCSLLLATLPLTLARLCDTFG